LVEGTRLIRELAWSDSTAEHLGDDGFAHIYTK
jgi:hypothetical protein